MAFGVVHAPELEESLTATYTALAWDKISEAGEILMYPVDPDTGRQLEQGSESQSANGTPATIN
jgi:hypothetical protein